MHGVEFLADDHVGLDGFPAQGLLTRLKCHRDAVEIVGIAGLLLRREIGEHSRASRAQQRQQHRQQKLLQHARSLTCAR